MEHGPFEDAFPIENGDVAASYVCLPEDSSEVTSEGLVGKCFFSFKSCREHLRLVCMLRDVFGDVEPMGFPEKAAR